MTAPEDDGLTSEQLAEIERRSALAVIRTPISIELGDRMIALRIVAEDVSLLLAEIQRRHGTLEEAGKGMRTAIDGISERYAEMFSALGLGDPLDSVALQECSAAVAVWDATLERENA